jgi:hypothetical protein
VLRIEDALCLARSRTGAIQARARAGNPIESNTCFRSGVVKKSFYVLAAALAIISTSNRSEASPINICNTGQWDSRCGTAPASWMDYNYHISSSPYGEQGTQVVPDDGYPIGPAWIANDAVSRWIGPGGLDDNSDAYGGWYRYYTTFTIGAGFDPATARISGAWAADDVGYMYLNDFLVSTTSGYSNWTRFAVAGDYAVTGTNVLSFLVYNGCDPNNGYFCAANPSGLRTEFASATVEPFAVPAANPVPEPGTITLFATGGLALFGRLRTSRRKPQALFD